jgi:hypothetical protein
VVSIRGAVARRVARTLSVKLKTATTIGYSRAIAGDSICSMKQRREVGGKAAYELSGATFENPSSPGNSRLLLRHFVQQPLAG